MFYAYFNLLSLAVCYQHPGEGRVRVEGECSGSIPLLSTPATVQCPMFHYLCLLLLLLSGFGWLDYKGFLYHRLEHVTIHNDIANGTDWLTR